MPKYWLICEGKSVITLKAFKRKEDKAFSVRASVDFC